MNKFRHFWIGFVTGWLTIILFIIAWTFFLPHSSYENDLSSQVIILDNNEKVLFTFDNGCVNTSEPDTPVLTYLKNNNMWESKLIPEGTIEKDDEYILTTSFDKSLIYLLLPQRNGGFSWDLAANEFQPIFDTKALETGKEYIHEMP